jgi:aminoglycoside phosphotransferase (APT) family kinase protein
MASVEGEIPLSGGRVTAGVVRVGNSVRRPPTANSDFVHRLLEHLAARGFEGAPSFLGTDESGRDVFTFIDGYVPPELAFHDDATLRGAASLIRGFHDLSAELAAARAAQAVGIEVICHNDLSPCNFVFRAGVPIAMIDFDVAAPGSRLYDLGYAAWLWLDLGSSSITASDQKRRLAAFAKAYGMHEPSLVLAAALRRQGVLVAEGNRIGNVAMAQWATECMEWTRNHIEHLI